MKKVVVSLGIMLSLGMGSCLLTNAPLVPAVSAASIEVDRSSAWFDKSSRTFGAEVTFNGEPMTVAYWCISNGDVENVYQRKNGSDWVFIGTRGPGSNDYHFPSQDSVSLFIKVGNVAAQSQGYDHL